LDALACDGYRLLRDAIDATTLTKNEVGALRNRADKMIPRFSGSIAAKTTAKWSRQSLS
jgi:hypothetical protein